MKPYDLVVVRGKVLLPSGHLISAEIGISDGRIAALSDSSLPRGGSTEVIDAGGRLVLPGAIDSHFHLGIYRDLADDARSETDSAVRGGVTTILSYFRSGGHYLNRSDSYRQMFPEVVNKVSGNSKVDFGFHLAPIESRHIGEMRWLVEEWGVTSFKYFMFYKGFNLAGDSSNISSFLLTEDPYDLGHLFEILEEASALNRQTEGRVSVSLHAEHAEILRVFIERARNDDAIDGLAEYHAARPALSERLAIQEAGVLADATGAPINLLHLSGRDALEAASTLRDQNQEVDLALETTLHHLCLTHDMLSGVGGKVNPPIRTSDDNEALWEGCRDGRINSVVSDHACCMVKNKADLWPAYAGFGGTGLLYPLLFSEGHLKRGLSLRRIVDLVATNPARIFNLGHFKRGIAIGGDADLCVLDPTLSKAVSVDALGSAQDHTPFDGLQVTGWPTDVIVRGMPVLRSGRPTDQYPGQYMYRSGRQVS